MGEYWYDLAFAYQGSNNKNAALAAYRRAADLGNADAQYYLGQIFEYGREGWPEDHKQALYWYRKAAAQDYPDALNDLAWMYATSSDPTVRNPTVALEYSRKAVSLGKDQPNPNYLDTLAESLYVNEQQAEAIKTEQQAIALASPEHKGIFEKQLEKYQLALNNKNRQVKDNK